MSLKGLAAELRIKAPPIDDLQFQPLTAGTHAFQVHANDPRKDDSALRIPALVFAVLGLVGCSSQPRFVHTGGNANPFVMFDSQTAEACYAGSQKALRYERGSVNSSQAQAVTEGKPFTSAILPFSVAVEERKVEQEYHRQATALAIEDDRLGGLQQLPTCQSLLAADRTQK